MVVREKNEGSGGRFDADDGWLPGPDLSQWHCTSANRLFPSILAHTRDVQAESDTGWPFHKARSDTFRRLAAPDRQRSQTRTAPAVVPEVATQVALLLCGSIVEYMIDFSVDVDGKSYTLKLMNYPTKYTIASPSTEIKCNVFDDRFMTWMSKNSKNRYLLVDSHPEVFKEYKRTHEDAYSQMGGESIGLNCKFLTRAGGTFGDPTIGETVRGLSRHQRTEIGESKIN